MPTNTTYDPANINFFDKTKLNKDAIGVQATITAGATQNIDYVIADDALIMTSSLIAIGAAQGDKIDMQVIHPIAGVVFQPITGWFIDPNSSVQPTPRANFPAKIFAGLTLRIVYHSTGSNNVWVALNIDKDKVLE